MFSALVKKQFMELATLFSFGKRRSKRGSTGGALLTLGLYVLIGISLGASMSLLADSMGLELLNKGEDWKFFAVLDVLGLLLATLITMFNADLTLFRAKDNEILLSMPIPPGYILLARMLPLYFISLIFTSSVVVPAIMVYRDQTGAGFGMLLLNVLILMVLGFLALALSSVLGWLISLINSKLKNNAIVSMILTVAFLGAYFYFYFQMNKFTQALVNGSSAMADNIRKFCPPAYWVGSGQTGSITGLVLGALSIAVIFGVIYFALSRTFRGVVINASKGGSAKVMGGSVLKSGTPETMLLKKELRRFTTSTSYMMNCGLGSAFMLVASVLAIIKRSALVGFLEQLDVLTTFANFVPGIIAPGFLHGVHLLLHHAVHLFRGQNHLDPPVSASGSHEDLHVEDKDGVHPLRAGHLGVHHGAGGDFEAVHLKLGGHHHRVPGLHHLYGLLRPVDKPHET